MSIEDLSKSQLLLLMLLVNFVTSIATAVLTVSLLDQAPPVISQTVNRIVDHTIETIATSSSPLATIISVPTPAKTVVVTNDELLTKAVAAAAARSVDIYSQTYGTTTPPLAAGTYLPKARAVVTATQVNLPKNVMIVFADGSSDDASISRAGATLTIYGFADAAKLPVAPSPNLIAHTDVKQGQTVVSLTADGSAITGIVSKVDDAGVHISMPAIPGGNTAVNLSGDIVGVSSGVAGLFFPAEKINTLLTATST